MEKMTRSFLFMGHLSSRGEGIEPLLIR